MSDSCNGFSTLTTKTHRESESATYNDLKVANSTAWGSCEESKFSQGWILCFNECL